MKKYYYYLLLISFLTMQAIGEKGKEQEGETLSRRSNTKTLSRKPSQITLAANCPLPLSKKIKHIIIPASLERVFHKHICRPCRLHPEEMKARFNAAVLGCDIQEILFLIDRVGIHSDEPVEFINPWNFQYTNTSLNLSPEHQHPYFKGTALCWAVLQGQIALVKELIKRKANPNLNAAIKYPAIRSLKKYARANSLPRSNSTALENKDNSPREEQTPRRLSSSSSINLITSPDITYHQIHFTPLGGLLQLPEEIHTSPNPGKEQQYIKFKSRYCKLYQAELIEALKKYKKLNEKEEEIYKKISFTYLPPQTPNVEEKSLSKKGLNDQVA